MLLGIANSFDVMVAVAAITIPAIVAGVPAIFAAVSARRTRHEVKTGNGHTAGQAIDNIGESLQDLRAEQHALRQKVAANQFRTDMQVKITHARLNEIERAISKLKHGHQEIEDALGIEHEDE